MPTLSSVYACDTNADGFASFDFTNQTNLVLTAQSNPPSNYIVSYHQTSFAANGGFNQISNTTSYVNGVANQELVYIRIENISTSLFVVGSFSIIATPIINPLFTTIAPICQNTTPPILPPTSAEGITGTWSPGFIDTSIAGTFVYVFTPDYQCASNVTMNVTISPIPTPIGIGYSIVNNSGNQTVTVEVQGSGNYVYNLDNGPSQNIPIFTNVPLGNHSITVVDQNGCGSLMISNIDVNLVGTLPPTGSTTQSFIQGQMLSDLNVSGQNIQWYGSSTNKSVNNFNLTSSSLPSNTLLVNGTTYYASQKVGGYESTSRLPVTVQNSLQNSDFQFNNLSFEPNPVIDFLSLKSDKIINSIEVYDVLGNQIITQKNNKTNFQVDLSALNSGMYFVKVNSEGKQKTIKVLKQ